MNMKYGILNEEEVTMDDQEFFSLLRDSARLKLIAEEYPHRTIENIIANMESRIKAERKRRGME